ncbi:acylphosphatase [Oleiagrimonas sp. C23AA]|uniref:acylphosphatase n=1 Tax=Oleiagrimonas sp. C23AA TaxID=2719047 RepID=UPI001420457D|nr:acylphosphatase [Oleiagrimonas sp. C23AA]NII11583.1 acylphosphatase [Oleiagrimonas sp. C23AA]
MAAARFMVEGHVQGVFFRAHTRQHACRLGLTGMARNLEDGRVQVIAHGDAAALAELEQCLQQGSPRSRVDRVTRHPHDGEAPDDFVTA